MLKTIHDVQHKQICAPGAIKVDQLHQPIKSAALVMAAMPYIFLPEDEHCLKY